MGQIKELELKKKLPSHEAHKRVDCPNCFRTVVVPIAYRATADLLCDRCYSAYRVATAPNAEELDRRADMDRASEQVGWGRI